MGWLVLVAAAQGYLALWLAVALIACHAAGAPPKGASLGIGPTRTVGRLRGTELRLGALPLGGWVQGHDELPGPLLVLPHLALLVVAAALTPPEVHRALQGWLGGWLGVGEVRIGLLHGLARAAALARAQPVAAAFGVATALGAANVLQGAVQWLGRRSLALQVGVTVGQALALVALAARALWLDLWS